jgi:hypothetical protein
MSLPAAVTQEQQTSILHPGPIEEAQSPTPEPFPLSRDDNSPLTTSSPTKGRQSSSEGVSNRDDPSASSFAGRLRSASKRFEESNLPKGMWDATASIASSIPSLVDIRRGSFGSEGWSAEGQVEDRERRSSIVRRRSSQTGEDSLKRPSLSGPKSPGGTRSAGSVPHHDTLTEGVDDDKDAGKIEKSPVIMTQQANAQVIDHEKRGHFDHGDSSNDSEPTQGGVAISPFISTPEEPYRTGPFDNGYHFPPKHTWTEATTIFLIGFWHYTTTWMGFLVVVYMLNVIAWGGMIFLLLCNAAPAMCSPTCDDLNSPRRIWIEYDAQILTALFCVTGFGLIPWRFRDLYYLLKYRLKKDQLALRRLAGIHREWFRLEGSQHLPAHLGPDNVEMEGANHPESILPYPLKSISNAPLTGIRASPTPVWKLDYVIWMFVWNTFLQAVLSGIMWGLNRFDRPSWATGLFVGLACLVGACAGIMIFMEGKKVKGVEGVPVSDKDQERLKKDGELGIVHINNIKDAVPKEKKGKGYTKEAGLSGDSERVA